MSRFVSLFVLWALVGSVWMGVAKKRNLVDSTRVNDDENEKSHKLVEIVVSERESNNNKTPNKMVQKNVSL